MHLLLFAQAAGLVVPASGDAMLRVWRLSDGECLRTLEGHTEQVNSVLDMGGGRVVSGGWGGTLRVWDALSGQQLEQISTAQEGGGDGEDICCIAALPGGRVATGHRNGEIRLWRLGEGVGAAGVLAGHMDAANELVLLGGGRAQPMLASASNDCSLRLWDVDVGTCTAVLDGHDSGASALADLGGGLLLSGDGAGALRVWDVGTAACLATAESEDGPVWSLCVLADGRIAIGGQGGRLRIWAWDAASKALTQEGEPLAGHTDGVGALVPVGTGAAQQLLSGSADSTLRLWGRDASGAWVETAVLRGHTDHVQSIAVVRSRQPAAPGQ